MSNSDVNRPSRWIAVAFFAVFNVLRTNFAALIKIYICLLVIVFVEELSLDLLLTGLDLRQTPLAWLVGEGVVVFILLWFLFWRLGRLSQRSRTAKHSGA